MDAFFVLSDPWLNPERLFGVLKRSLILFVWQPDILVLWKPFLKADASRAAEMGIFVETGIFTRKVKHRLDIVG